MKTLKAIIILVIFNMAVFQISYSQEKPIITWAEILIKATDPIVKDSIIKIEGYKIIDESVVSLELESPESGILKNVYSNTAYDILSQKPFAKIENKKIVISKEIKIVNCDLVPAYINNISFKMLDLTNPNQLKSEELFDELWFENCQFDGFEIWDGNLQSLFIKESTFKNSFFFWSSIEKLNLDSCHFNRLNVKGLSKINYFGLRNSKVQTSKSVKLDSNNFNSNFSIQGEISRVNISNNTFIGDLGTLGYGTFDNIEIFNNNVQSSFQITNAVINDKLKIRGNKFYESISFMESVYPEFSTYIDWDQLLAQNNKLAVFLLSDNGVQTSIYDRDLSNNPLYFDLLYEYQQFYDLYKRQGNIESANAVYIELKDLQTSRYRFLYEKNENLKSWFRWKLYQLLKVYTEHGTDPAKSLVVSFYIIIIFGVFYFFFPSDWDVTSKSKIISNLKSAINKKESGTTRAIITAITFILISFINAFTLSLNSFTTLGFGNIPTSGVARYVTIIQGFIGWFMLSIFSVALINQVLS